MNTRAMFDLLPLLRGMKARGHWPVIAAGAVAGRATEENAVFTVDDKTKGSPITNYDLCALIDRMASMNPDQRSDCFASSGSRRHHRGRNRPRYPYVAGATSVLGRQARLRPIKGGANFFIREIRRHPPARKSRPGATSRRPSKRLLKKRAWAPSWPVRPRHGAIMIVAEPMTKFQPIMTRSTRSTRESTTSRGNSRRSWQGHKGVDTAFNDAKDWVATRSTRGGRRSSSSTKSWPP